MTDHLDRAQARYMQTLRTNPPLVPTAPLKKPRAAARAS